MDGHDECIEFGWVRLPSTQHDLLFKIAWNSYMKQHMFFDEHYRLPKEANNPWENKISAMDLYMVSTQNNNIR
ncbi:hypothetical protein WAI453_008363 [Rhynchosporium graminicola]